MVWGIGSQPRLSRNLYLIYISFMPVKIKICGITNCEDANLAADVGADALGFVFYEPSPRYVTIKVAQEIVAVLPPFIAKVGLFVNAEKDWVYNVINAVSLDILQFHGDESDVECRRYKKSYVKAINVGKATDWLGLGTQYPHAAALLLDGANKDTRGGSGKTFDWSFVPEKLGSPVILAGGLNVDNVQVAIKQVKPYAVDVSSGLESILGKKDPIKLTRFISKVRAL